METIGQHFEAGRTRPGGRPYDILDLITDGEMKEAAVAGFTSLDWEKLKKACRAAVEERSVLPFLGRKTLGDLCGRAMEILAQKSNIRTPKCWIPIMRTLRAGGPSILRPYMEVSDEEIRQHEVEVDRQVREAFPEYKGNAPK